MVNTETQDIESGLMINELNEKKEEYTKKSKKFYDSKRKWVILKYTLFCLTLVKGIFGILISSKFILESVTDPLNTAIHCIALIVMFCESWLKIGETLKTKETAGDSYSKLLLQIHACRRKRGQDLSDALTQIENQEIELIDKYDEP